MKTPNGYDYEEDEEFEEQELDDAIERGRQDTRADMFRYYEDEE